MGRYHDWLVRLLGAVTRRRAEPRHRVDAPPAVSQQPVPTEAGVPESGAAPLEGRAPVLGVSGRGVRKREDAGELLQFPRSEPDRITDIVIGVDFGTSCSKVVVQSPYKLGGRAVAVPFAEAGHSSTPYLIPAVVFVDTTDTVRLIPSDGATAVRHLKVGILDRSIGGGSGLATEFSRDLLGCTVGYIALVLREARRWFLTTQFESYGEDRIRWSLNLGIPSAGYDDKQIRSEYEALAEAAWLASLEDRPLRLDSLDGALQRARSEGGRAGVAIGVIPEVAAQVVGYAKSRFREEGLHVLVDFGASTLDICSFILRAGEGDDVYSLLTATVKRLGLLELHQRRMVTTRCIAPFHAIPEDIVQRLPDWSSVQFSDPTIRRQLEQCDLRFKADCVRQLLGTIRDLRRRRDPLSRRWRDGLPVFVCGGGALSPVFSDFLNQAHNEAISFWEMRGLRHRPMPPQGLLGADGKILEPAIFNRLNVAYGLSFDGINIGDIESPGDIDDINPPGGNPKGPTRSWEDRFVSKDQV